MQTVIDQLGFVNKVVELRASDMSVPYDNGAVYIFGISLQRFQIDYDTASSILDGVEGFVDRMLDGSNAKPLIPPVFFFPAALTIRKKSCTS